VREPSTNLYQVMAVHNSGYTQILADDRSAVASQHAANDKYVAVLRKNEGPFSLCPLYIYEDKQDYLELVHVKEIKFEKQKYDAKLKFIDNWLFITKRDTISVVNLNDFQVVTTIKNKAIRRCKDIQFIFSKLLIIHPTSMKISDGQSLYTIFDFQNYTPDSNRVSFWNYFF
jgi:hypothetical protein